MKTRIHAARIQATQYHRAREAIEFADQEQRHCVDREGDLMTDSKKHVAALGDVELVRMLTLDTSRHSGELLEAAEAEARRRGLPIDPAFIPTTEPDEPSSEVEVEVDEFQSGGRDIRCTQCGGTHFRKRKMLMNTRGLTYFNLDWLNKGAMALICKQCKMVQLFAED